MTIRPVARVVYGLVAGVLILAGTAILLLGTGVLPTPLVDFILDFGEGNANTMHLIQEYATLLIFIGLVNAWCVRHYERSLYFHWAMTVFWALLALVHWLDYQGRFHAGWGQVIDTAPFLVYLLLGLLRRGERAGAPQAAR